MKKKLVLITDGDNVARRAVETAARNLGVRCISRSAFIKDCRPAKGEELIEYIKQAEGDVVLVMFDDQGNYNTGTGEKELKRIATYPDFEILGVVAVASNTSGTDGIRIQLSIDRNGNMVEGPVNKEGDREKKGHKFLEGDTVDILNELDIPIIIGIGDIGKMDGADWTSYGAPVTTKAINEILLRSGVRCFAESK